jgi:uncharacterized membrane protein YkvA (DUF1232 family)
MVTTNDANSSNAIAAGATPVAAHAAASAEPAHPPLRQWLERAVKGASEALGQRYLARLITGQGTLRESMSGIPDRLQRVAQQSRLVLELLDDVRAGAYHDLSWYSVPVAAAALLYTVNPADVVPDVLPFLGGLDDAALLALAVRLLRHDLRAYCRFKGYPEAQYFDLPS